MNHQQKDIILTLLKENEMTGNYTNRYWFTYQDFLDPTDPFTDFSCENLGGKQGYVDLIQTLIRADETAKIFVAVYGYEEDHNELFIYADTLIIFSKRSLSEIEQIFNAPEDIFPSDIGEETDFSNQFLIDANGELIPAEKLFSDEYFAYYCWWD